MVIDLEITKVKENDLLIIKKNKKGVAYAAPITKDNLVKTEQARIFNLEKRVDALEKEKKAYELFITDKINKFILAMKGDATNV